MSNDNQLLKSFKDILSFDNSTKAYTTNATVARVDGSTAWVHISGGVDETPAAMAVSAKPGDTVQLKIENGMATITGNISSPPTDNSVAYRAVDMVEEANQVINAVNQHFWTDTNGVHVTENEQNSNPASQGKNVVFNSEGMLFRSGDKNLALYSDNGMAIYDGTEDSNAIAEFTKDGITMSRDNQRMLTINADSTVIGVTDVLDGLTLDQIEPASSPITISPDRTYSTTLSTLNPSGSYSCNILDENDQPLSSFNASAAADISFYANIRSSLDNFSNRISATLPFIPGQSLTMSSGRTIFSAVLQYVSNIPSIVFHWNSNNLFLTGATITFSAQLKAYKYGSAPKVELTVGGDSTIKSSLYSVKNVTIQNCNDFYTHQDIESAMLGKFGPATTYGPEVGTEGLLLSLKGSGTSGGSQYAFNNSSSNVLYKREYISGSGWSAWKNVYRCPIPVGGVYMTIGADPSYIWPGTSWLQLTNGQFLRASTSVNKNITATYTDGGRETVSLTASNLPAHKHNMPGGRYVPSNTDGWSSDTGGNLSGSDYKYLKQSTSDKVQNITETANNDSLGTMQSVPFDIKPKYINVYMYIRTA